MEKYTGYRPADYQQPYAKFYNETVQPANQQVLAAVAQSPLTSGSIFPVSEVTNLAKRGYLPTETGYTLEKDGSARVAVLTNMPRVTPPMWDWWFGWHGCSDSRYKLWHPKAHLSAAWKDGKTDHAYIGRTSLIAEYIGANLEKAAISFIVPQNLGFTTDMLANKNEAVYICARVGYSSFPLQFGYLVHQVRATQSGSEMRSRFWMGGSHIQIGKQGLASNFLSGIIRKVKTTSAKQAENLLLHCAEEMSHLAAFLPDLYETYRQQ